MPTSRREADTKLGKRVAKGEKNRNRITRVPCVIMRPHRGLPYPQRERGDRSLAGLPFCMYASPRNAHDENVRSAVSPIRCRRRQTQSCLEQKDCGIIPEPMVVAPNSRRHLSPTMEGYPAFPGVIPRAIESSLGGRRIFAHLLLPAPPLSEIGRNTDRRSEALTEDGRKRAQIPPPMVKKPYCFSRRAVSPPARDNGRLTELGEGSPIPPRAQVSRFGQYPRPVSPHIERRRPIVAVSADGGARASSVGGFRSGDDARPSAQTTTPTRRSHTPPGRSFDIINGLSHGHNNGGRGGNDNGEPPRRCSIYRYGNASTVGQTISWM